MRTFMALTTALALAACLIQGSPALAQATISDTECQSLRQRLAEHARLSEGVRRAVAAQAGTAPAAATPSAPTATSRADAIRARLEQIPKERQTLDEQRLGAMMKFELGRAGQIQAQMQALDAEKAALQKEQAALPAGAAAAPAAPAPAATPAATASDPVVRIGCKDMPAAVANALKIRRGELGAREDQAGAIPLVALKGQTADQIAQELAAQFASGAAATTQVGLSDTNGDGKLDGFVDVPAPGIFRMVYQRSDGTVGVDVFRTSAAGTTVVYGDMTRRLDEATARQTKQTIGDLLATRPVGAPRAATQTAEFGSAYAQFQAGNFAEAARLGAAAARSTEFQNFRGQNVRLLEIIGPVTGGVSVRRAVVLAQPNDQELWEETTTIVRPASYLRTDVEVTRRQETRTTSGAAVGAPTVSAPAKFSLDR
jgi:hypothetical protein